MNCPICGTECKETTWGRHHCPNHGIVNEGDEEEDNKKEKSYIG